MPIITISRMYGSGGSEVAAATARELGWALLDNAVVDSVAARTGLPAPEVAAREERVSSLTERLVEAMAMTSGEMLSPVASARFAPSDAYLLEVTRRVIEDAATHGPVVIVGRGAQEMLGSREDLLSIFCYAPRRALVRRVMARDQLGGEAAAKRVDEVNRQRAQWVDAHWSRAWAAPEHYHLCVNTDSLGIPGAALTIVDTARRRFGASVDEVDRGRRS